MNNSDLKKSILKGILWQGVNKYTTLFFSLVVGIILARLLMPSDFGIIGILGIFTTIGLVLRDGGFGAALIQNKDTTPEDFSTIFFFNIIVSIIIYIILFFSAPLIAKFFDETILTILTRIVSLNIVITSFSTIQYTIFTKKLNFKVQAKISVVSTVISGITGVVMAYKEFGLWSLVAQSIVLNVLRSILPWFLSEWKPTLVISKNSFKKLFNYGSKLFLTKLIAHFFDHIYIIIIGKMFSASTLGYYNRAKKFTDITIVSILGVIQDVTFPAFSKIQDNQELLKKGIRKSLVISISLIFPALLLLILNSKPLILLLLTSKWANTIPYLRLICIGGLFYPLLSIQNNLLKISGRSDLFLYIDVFKKILIIISIIITYKWGVIGLLYGQIAVGFVSVFIHGYFSNMIIRYSFKEQLKDVIPCLISSTASLLLTYAVISQLNINGYLLQLFINTFAYLLILYLIVRVLRLDLYSDILYILKEFMRKSNASFVFK